MTETKAIATIPKGDELRALLTRCDAKRPKAEDLAMLRRVLALPDMWREFDLAHSAAMIAIDNIEATAFSREAMCANYDGKRRELALPTDGPLERSLVDHVALCWMRLQATEQVYSGRMAQSLTLPQADYWDRHLAAAQRRYLRAVETLAKVRRLRLPALQVNIGEKQVNVAQ